MKKLFWAFLPMLFLCCMMAGCSSGTEKDEPITNTSIDEPATNPTMNEGFPTTSTNGESQSTSANETLPSYLGDDYYNELFQKQKGEILSRVDNIQPFDKLTTKTYSLADIESPFGTYFSSWTYSGNIYTMQRIDEKYEIECLRDMGDGNYYAVYKVENGWRMFAFFPKDQGNLFSHAIYLMGPLEQSKFETLKRGDSLSKVMDIDPTFSASLESAGYAGNSSMVLRNNIYFTMHMFRDRMALITYQPVRDDEDDLEKVLIDTVTIFSDQKIVIDFDGYMGNGTYDYTILPQDYPE